MGAGKSTIGRHLAKMLSMDFYDTDQEIEKRTGADVSWIFDVEGEEGFREREKNMIAELSQKTGVVLATGGGAIVSPESRNLLAARGVVVYLKASVEQQMERTLRDKRRPLIQEAKQSEDPEAALRVIMDERSPLYAEIADYTVSTDMGSVKAVANEVIRLLDESD